MQQFELLGFCDPLFQKFKIADNNREQVVEIMCDTSRQLADGLEPLGHSQCAFGRVSGGQVVYNAAEVNAVPIPELADRKMQRKMRSAPFLAGDFSPDADDFAFTDIEVVADVGIVVFGPRFWHQATDVASDHLVVRIPEQGLSRSVGGPDDAAVVNRQNGIDSGFQQSLEPRCFSTVFTHDCRDDDVTCGN